MLGQYGNVLHASRIQTTPPYAMSSKNGDPLDGSATSPERVNDKPSTELRTIASNESSTPMMYHHGTTQPEERHYRLYKRRFFGLAQLVLLNVSALMDGAVDRSRDSTYHCLSLG